MKKIKIILILSILLNVYMIIGLIMGFDYAKKCDPYALQSISCAGQVLIEVVSWPLWLI